MLWLMLMWHCGCCCLFQVGDAILKLYNAELAPHATAMGCMEVAAYLCLGAAAAAPRGGNSCSGGSGSAVQMLGTGLVGGGASSQAGAAPEQQQQLMFVAMTKAEGVPLGDCMDELSEEQWVAVAEATGRCLAGLHASPLPAAAAVAREVEAAPAVSCSTAWVARDGLVYHCSSSNSSSSDSSSSACALVTLDTRWRGEQGMASRQLEREQRQQQLQMLHLFPAVAAELHLPPPPPSPPSQQEQQQPCSEAPSDPEPGHGPGSSSAGACCRCCLAAAWQPFLGFLRRQRRHAVAALTREASLPLHLLRQLDDYLPTDPGALLQLPGCSACGNGSSSGIHGGGLPTWVHGDLTPGNVLVSSALLGQRQQSAVEGGTEPELAVATKGVTGTASASPGVVLLDYADSGHGDPLWDLVVLCLRSLRCVIWVPRARDAWWHT